MSTDEGGLLAHCCCFVQTSMSAFTTLVHAHRIHGSSKLCAAMMRCTKAAQRITNHESDESDGQNRGNQMKHLETTSLMPFPPLSVASVTLLRLGRWGIHLDMAALSLSSIRLPCFSLVSPFHQINLFDYRASHCLP